jgi:hypothetical protein
MQAWLRLLIVWFVAIALPAQGIAGVAMAHCGAALGPGASQEAPAHSHADPGTTADPHHGKSVQQRGHHLHPDAPAGSDLHPDPWSDLSQHKCSSCAACCAATALISTLPGLPEPSAAAPDFVVAMVAVGVFASDGPDRPPRTPPV